EKLARERAARNVADVQLEERVALGRCRDREASPAPVFHEQIDVLAREILQALVCRQLERDDGDIGSDLLDLLDPARKSADLDVAGAAHFAHFDGERRLRSRHAEKREPLRFFALRQRARLMRAVIDFTFEDPAFARSTGAVAAAVRNHEIGAHRRAENALAFIAGEGVAAGFYGNLERHRCRYTRETE